MKYFILLFSCFVLSYSLMAQISRIKFNEADVIICKKKTDIKALSAKILTSLNTNPIICANGNPGVCTGNINGDVVGVPINAMNNQAFGPVPYFVNNQNNLTSPGRRIQYLVKASDINPSGLSYYSKIRSLSFRLMSTNLVTKLTLTSYTIKLKCTQLQQLSGNFDTTGTAAGEFKTVFSGTVTLPTIFPAINPPVWINHPFTLLPNGFGWDGTSNLLVEICYSGGTTATLNPIVSGRTNMSYISCVYSSSTISSNICTNQNLSTEADGTFNYLPDMRFELCEPKQPTTNYNISWAIIQEPSPGAGILTPVNNTTLTGSLNMTQNGIYKVQITATNKNLVANPGDITSDIITIDLRAIIAPIFSFKDTILCSNDPPLLLSNLVQPPGGKFSIAGSGGGLVQTQNPYFATFDPKKCFFYSPNKNKIVYTVTDLPCVYADSFRLITNIFFRESEILNDPGKPICWEEKNLTLEPKLFFAFPEAEFFGPNVDVITGEFKHRLAGVGTHSIGYSTINNKNRCGMRDSIIVKVVARPQFLIGPSDLDGCAPFKVCLNTVGPSILKSFDWRYHINDSINVIDDDLGIIEEIEIFDSSKLATPCATFYSEGLNNVKLIAIDENQCPDTVETYVNVLPVPNPRFTSSKKEITNVFSEVVFRNKTADAQKFVWKIEEVISINRNDTFSYKYDFVGKAGTYVVSLTATNEANCSSTVYDTIVVISDYRLYIPTAFNLRSPSPNNVFKFTLGDEAIKENFKLEIFNKWGGKIFESTKNGDYWNGKKDNTGAFCESGLYLWQLTFKDVAKKTQQKSGTVLLIE